jgi:hypothetical protein
MRRAYAFLAVASLIFATSTGYAQQETKAAPQVLPPPTPVAPAPSAPVIAPAAVPLGIPCACHHEHGSCCRRLWDWLTYRPLTEPNPCGCCHNCVPCCTPPLYTFFLNNCANALPPNHTAVVTWEHPKSVVNPKVAESIPQADQGNLAVVTWDAPDQSPDHAQGSHSNK